MISAQEATRAIRWSARSSSSISIPTTEDSGLKKSDLDQEWQRPEACTSLRFFHAVLMLFSCSVKRIYIYQPSYAAVRYSRIWELKTNLLSIAVSAILGKALMQWEKISLIPSLNDIWQLSLFLQYRKLADYKIAACKLLSPLPKRVLNRGQRVSWPRKMENITVICRFPVLSYQKIVPPLLLFCLSCFFSFFPLTFRKSDSCCCRIFLGFLPQPLPWNVR